VAIDPSHALMVTSRGLEMYNFRLDPTNQANILHHCEMDDRGHLALSPLGASVHPHFHSVHHMWRSGSLQNRFLTLREALRGYVEAKNEHVRAAPGGVRGELLNMSAFDRINREGRSTFFNGSEG